jgi:hypothetical protein
MARLKMNYESVEGLLGGGGGERSVATPLSTQHKSRKSVGITSMHRAEFEPALPVFQRFKTVHGTTTTMGYLYFIIYFYVFLRFDLTSMHIT